MRTLRVLGALLLLMASGLVHGQAQPRINFFPPVGVAYNYTTNQSGPVTQIMLTAHLLSTANVTLSGAQTIDGTSATAGTTVLLRGQSTQTQNGMWIVQSGAWIRSPLYPSGFSIAGGCAVDVFIEAGTANANTVWNTQSASTIIIDTTATTWAEITLPASTTRLGPVLVTNGTPTVNPAVLYVATSHTPPNTGLQARDCVNFQDSSGAVGDWGDANGQTGTCAVENATTGHLILNNGGFHPTASAGTLNTNATDHWGVVTGLSAATTLTITFSSAYPNNVVGCTANTSASGNAVGVTYTSVSSTITAVVFTFASLTGSVSYTCFGTN